MEFVKSDVTVIGGGLSGICAAVAAAREGASVSLIGNRPVLGGNSSSEIRMWTRGATGGGNIFAEEMGILGELKLTNLYRNAECNVVMWDEVLFDTVHSVKNIKLFLNTHITSVDMKDTNTIESVSGFQMGNEMEYAFESPIFIDCTGDGTIGYLAGAEYRVGRESKDEFQESLAVDKADSMVLSSSIFFHTKRADKKVKFIPPDYAYKIHEIEALLNRGGRIVNEKMSGCDYWWLEYGGVKDTIKDNQEIALELKKIALGIWDYVKNSGKFDADYLTLEWIGNIPGKRESRRMMGDYILTQNDIMENRHFEDGVCYGGWYLDFHPSEGIYSDEEFCIQIPVNIYDIPLRCLYSKNISNLLFAGRIISVTHAAFSSTRIMDTCALTGHAAGVAAGICANRRKMPADVYRQDLMYLRQKLLANDMFVLGCKNEDSLDKARHAKVTASSWRKAQNAENHDKKKLDRDMFLVLPKPYESRRFEILLDSQSDTEMEIEIYKTSSPSGFTKGQLVDRVNLKISRCEESWEKVELNFDSYEGFIYVHIHKNPDISLNMSNYSCTGMLCGYTGSREYYNPCVSIQDGDMIYSPEKVINGYNRVYGMPNSWISKKLNERGNEWLALEWDSEIKISEIRLFFNPDLNKELPSSRTEKWAEHHGFSARSGMPPELVKDYSVYALKYGEWERIIDVKDNHKRLAVHKVSDIGTSKLKIQLINSHGSPYFELFEVRVY